MKLYEPCQAWSNFMDHHHSNDSESISCKIDQGLMDGIALPEHWYMQNIRFKDSKDPNLILKYIWMNCKKEAEE